MTVSSALDEADVAMSEEEAMAALFQHLDFRCTACGAHGSCIVIAVKPPPVVDPTAPVPGTVTTLPHPVVEEDEEMIGDTAGDTKTYPWADDQGNDDEEPQP